MLLPGVLLEALSHWVCRGRGLVFALCFQVLALKAEGRSRLSTLRPARDRIQKKTGLSEIGWFTPPNFEGFEEKKRHLAPEHD